MLNGVLKPMRSAKNSPTASSLAPFKMAQAVPPSVAASSARRRQGKASRSGAAKVRGGQASRSRGSAGFTPRLGYVMAYRMGRRISGVPSWASTAPSRNSTREWTMDWRWITTRTCSRGRR